MANGSRPLPDRAGQKGEMAEAIHHLRGASAAVFSDFRCWSRMR